MKYSVLIAIISAATPALAHLQFLSTREFVPQEWIVSTPDAFEFLSWRVSAALMSYTDYLIKLAVPVPDSTLWPTMGTSRATAKTSQWTFSRTAIKTSPKYPNTRSFDLADLGRHNILEHEISLKDIMPF
ncbi:sterigmatocystin biosynthesis peroxidase stcC [Fusarium sp. NRRL 52700]|nr:sterigmatocystin biosynthesis peroxidase stcC [Fusarium sp. NRRL 52700]